MGVNALYQSEISVKVSRLLPSRHPQSRNATFNFVPNAVNFVPFVYFGVLKCPMQTYLVGEGKNLLTFTLILFINNALTPFVNVKLVWAKTRSIAKKSLLSEIKLLPNK
jgi:hypothetical protein